MKRGLLITFEGIEGSGKSTQIRLASEWLKTRGIGHVVTREPGGTLIGAEIRKILLSEGTQSLEPVAECLLYLADRFQHIAEVISPHLNAGEIVLCDRYHDSTLAYQGYARKISLDLLHRVWTQSGISIDPDLTFLFDLDPRVGIKRSLEKLKAARLDESRFEQESLEFHAKVRAGFLELSRLNPKRFVVVDGSQPAEEIHSEVIRRLQALL